jgi:hypothetical protein
MVERLQSYGYVLLILGIALVVVGALVWWGGTGDPQCFIAILVLFGILQGLFWLLGQV